jgi:Mg-chelatase subunit ChlD
MLIPLFVALGVILMFMRRTAAAQNMTLIEYITGLVAGGGGGRGGGSRGGATTCAADISGYSESRYVYTNPAVQPRDSLPTPSEASGNKQGNPKCKFFLSAKEHLARDYVLLVDRSRSMQTGRRWKDAQEAVATLAPFICQFDPDGIDVILFDHAVEKFTGIRAPEQVQALFEKHKPRGSTNLALALHSAFKGHFSSERAATTVLVITDGEPDSRSEVERIIVRAANSAESKDELSISFIQIGEDKQATKFLQYLDDDISIEGGGKCKMDIVDTVPLSLYKNMPFGELIANSLYD